MDAEKTGREVSPSLSHALRRLNEAKRILLVVGAGVVRADVTEQVRSLAHKTGAYCTTTLQSKGSFYPLREITVSRHNLEALLCHIHYDLCLVIGVDSAEGLIGLPSGERVLFVNEFPDETFRGE